VRRPSSRRSLRTVPAIVSVAKQHYDEEGVLILTQNVIFNTTAVYHNGSIKKLIISHNLTTIMLLHSTNAGFSSTIDWHVSIIHVERMSCHEVACTMFPHYSTNAIHHAAMN
jgi:hypothetical protein